MSSNTLSARLYYIIVAIYMGLNAFIFFVQNSMVTGAMSDVYLAASIGAGFLSYAAVIYAILEDQGSNTLNADCMLFPGVRLPKTIWYLGVLALIGVRGYFAYLSNHYASGAESVWGYVWIVASFILFLMTFPNAKTYLKAKAVAAQNRAKEAQKAS
jgi:hypothetical protein